MEEISISTGSIFKVGHYG